MLKSVSEELANAMLRGGQAGGVMIKMQKCRNVSDDRPRVVATPDIPQRQEATSLLVFLSLGVVVDLKVIEEAHAPGVVSQPGKILYADSEALPTAPGTPCRHHRQGEGLEMHPGSVEP
jgi:hypothetical protein